MGSFSMTCSISGLGISVGTPVRCLLMTASPYEDTDSRKTWIVRTPPLRAVYNDYGSIEGVHADDAFIAKLWLRGLREDVIEKGLGDNSCHDVPVAIDMSFEDMLAAIQERRLQVSQDALHFWMLPLRGPGSDGTHVPSLMRRVEELLESRFPGRVSRHAAKDKYVVDEPVPYMARVRFGQYQHGEECTSALEAARVAVENRGAEAPTKLTGVIAAGSGRYADSADLLVFPLPASTDEHVVGPQWDMAAGQSADKNKPLRVGLAMIREDVWQALIAYPHCDYVLLDCVECGQSPIYHKEHRRCPTESINGNPYKKPAKRAKYTHGPVFPADVPHVVEPREWSSEYVWYGLEAYKEGTRSTWAAVLKRFRRRHTGLPATVEAHAPDAVKDAKFDAPLEKALIENIKKARKKEETRIAALPSEERAALEAAQKVQQDAWETEERRRKEHPFFGDFRIGDADVRDPRMPGAWVFRDSVPGVIGVADHFSMLLADKVEAPATLLDAVAELSAVTHVLSSVGIVLKPAVSSGPQYPEWGDSIRFARTVLQIAEAAGKDHESESSMPAPATLDEAFEVVAKKDKSRQAQAKKQKAHVRDKTVQTAGKRPDLPVRSRARRGQPAP